MEKETKLDLLKAYYKINGNPTFEQLIKQVVLRTFDRIKIEAEKNQVCKRKAVGAAILEVDLQNELIIHYTAINGPSGLENKCSGIKGSCGCSHAEPRVIMKYLKRMKRNGQRGKTILLTTFSACINCANIIIDSGVIDVVAFEILAEHWAVEPNNAKAMLDRTLPHWTKQTLEDDYDNNIIKDWLYNDNKNWMSK